MSGILCAPTGGVVDYTGSATVTVGYFNLSGGGLNIDYWGFADNPGGTFGSVTPATWGSSGMTFRVLDYIQDNNFGAKFVVFAVNGYAPNAGWTTLNVAGTNFSRASASYGYDSTDNFTQWFWSGVLTNPYGTTIGATKALTWS